MLSGLELFDKLEVRRLKAPVAAGATDITDATAVATANRDLFCFMIGLGAITAGAATSIEIHGSDNNGSNYSLMEDDAGNECKVTVADTDDNKLVLVTIIKPMGTITHIKPVIKRATQNVVVDLVIGLTGNTRAIPTTQPSDVSHNDKFISPTV